MRKLIIALTATIIAVSCAKQPPKEIPAEVSMKKGMQYFERKKYKDAAEQFEAAIRNAADPDLAGNAQIFLADSHFLSKDYELAIPSYETYLRIYPYSSDAPRAKLRLGLCYYRQIGAPDRDIKNAEEALRIFSELRNENPGYAKEYELADKIRELRGLMGRRELLIAKFYLRTDKERPAVKRLQYIVENYPDTDVYPESLTMLGDYYGNKDGYEAEAIKYYRALIREFPNTKYSSGITSKLSKLLAKITDNLGTMENN
ncbi:outer membrane protein assembly factor BamD [Geovibrio ferrireducens]|uniref:outer membrane protein assembly factor BamD n=1 Tax=Geovibrio ferrireducens TaxID=46201 RepID=UPI00224532E1|nr:outer membrane protein assembly factor BamD [Geovibrio ferrireducens]